MASSEEIRKFVFMSYAEILQDFKMNNIKTKRQDEITYYDLKRAVQTMDAKHLKCRWRSERIRKNYYYIQYEGVIWLRDVYFNNYEMKFIDRDISWFEKRIDWYQENFIKNNVEYPQMDFHIVPMTKKQLSEFLNLDISTIKNGLKDMEKIKNNSSLDRNYINGVLYFSVNDIEWLLKNKFKRKYLELLEKYKMQLTEIFKANGGLYDNFFGRN